MRKRLYLRGPAESRLMARVIKSPSGCWLFTGARTTAGYGQVSGTYAHRLSFEMHKGTIPDGLCVLHRCDVPNCVNPKHLFTGTKADNNRDKSEKGRAPNGENASWSKLTDANCAEIRATYVKGNRWRTGGNCKALATRFGVAPNLITRIAHGTHRANPTVTPK